ncbi:MAG: hypothetical protein HQL84_05005 [Magnetococcales bacterium]|nr:hypothetical protein [Magnetococcales bacterium]MBF0149389.1 hypothetical protein [Magnetococcales bacterium]MBF0630904.1 hypothetical protein [Magnetococcales bacterium]
MNDERVLEAYRALSKILRNEKLGEDLPELTPRGLLIHKPEHLEDPHRVWEAVQAFAPDQGWICFQSEVTHFFNAGQCPPRGVILSAELCRVNSPTSLHVRPHPLGGWGVHRLETLPDGRDYWCETMDFLSVAHDVGKLSYQVFWQSDGEAGMVRRVARFCGLVPRKVERAGEAS